MQPLSTITLVTRLMVISLTPLAENAETGINWVNNSAIQSLIGKIFDRINHIDIVIMGEHDLVTRFGDQIDGLVRRREGVFFGKSVRIYGGQLLLSEDYPEGCFGDTSILSATITDPAVSVDLDTLGVIDRDYSEKSSFIQWDSSYRSFAKIWDQNHNDGYVVFSSGDTFETTLKCLMDPRGTYLVSLDDEADFGVGRMFNLMNSLWLHSGSYRLFFMKDEQIYTFDPFAINGTGYGALIAVKEAQDIPEIPESNFNGYPLRIDIFRSTYSEPAAQSANATKTVFEGADVEVSRVFAEVLNFTGTEELLE